MPDKIIDNKNRVKLDTNIKDLVSKGASEDDVMRYAKDFTEKFGIPKVDVDFKTPKEEIVLEKPKSTSIFGEMPGPKRAASESTKVQNLQQKEIERVEVEEGLQEIYKKNKEERVKKVKSEALKNTTKKALEADKISFVEGDSNWTSKQKEIQDHIEHESLVLTNDIKGNPLYKRSLGPIDSFVEAISQTYNKEKKASKFSSDTTLDRIKTAEEERENIKEPEAVPGGISGKVGEFFGGAAEIVGKAMVGARTGAIIGTEVIPIPVWGTTIGGITGAFVAMAPSSMEVGFTDETIRRYNERINQLEESNKFSLKKITQQEKIDAMNDAVSQGRVAAGVEAAKVLSLSLMPGSAAVTAEKGFAKAMGNFIKHTAYSAGEFAKVSAGGGMVTEMSAKLKGYNVITSDAFNNLFTNASEGAKTAIAFSVAHGSLGAVTAIPKYVKSSAFNYMSNIENSSIISYGMAQEKNGIIPEGSTQRIISEIEKYKQAKKRVPINLQNSENAGSFVGHIQKKINLENIKKQTDEAFHPEIDKQIQQVNLKMQELMKSPDPIIEEVDHLTGDTGDALPYTEKEKVAAEQMIEPVVEKDIKDVYKEAKPQITEPKAIEDVDLIVNKINNAEYVNETELDNAANHLYDLLDKYAQDKDTPTYNKDLSNIIEPLIDKIEQYEFRTKTKTSTVTEKVPIEVPRPTIERKGVKKELSQFEGNEATIRNESGEEVKGNIKIENGIYSIIDESGNKILELGEKQITDRNISLPDPSVSENPIKINENGDVESITLQLNKIDPSAPGLIPDKTVTVSFKTPKEGLDFAIRLRGDEIGYAPQKVFDLVYEDIQRQISEEVPIVKQEVKTVEQLRAEEQKEYDAIDPKDEVKKKEIYDKYDKLITPLLEKETQIKDANIDALNKTIKGTEYENDARSAGLREQTPKGVAGEVPRTTEVRVTETENIGKYKPEQQEFIRETAKKLGGDEQARKLFDEEGLHEIDQTYENFLLSKGCG